MIERIDTGTRSSKIVKYNGVVYLTGQVAEGDTIQAQVRTCLGKHRHASETGGVLPREHAACHHLASRHAGF